MLKAFRGRKRVAEDEYQREKDRILSRTPIPVFWLFGKSGSGKTSVIRFLTGAEDALIGSGFQPQTQESAQFDFPSPDQPLMRFIDTRGVGDIDYDPADDIAAFNDAAHVMLVTVRAMDHALADIMEPLRRIRRNNPHRPVVLVLTCLHEAYPGDEHPDPDPFDQVPATADIPADLSRSIDRQQQRFAGLVDRVVPVDLTKPEQDFAVADFGGRRLKQALWEVLPAAYRQTFLNASDALRPLKTLNERRAVPYVVSYSTMAATAAAIPAPWVDIPLVMAIQSHLIDRLRNIYGQQYDVNVVRNLAAANGGSLATQILLRGALKFIPFIGPAVNATLAYAYTYGLGKACCWYFGEVKAGNAPTEAEVQRVWKQEFTVAETMWKRRGAKPLAELSE
jgi:uncharacterized protein (DUF697 family)